MHQGWAFCALSGGADLPMGLSTWDGQISAGMGRFIVVTYLIKVQTKYRNLSFHVFFTFKQLRNNKVTHHRLVFSPYRRSILQNLRKKHFPRRFHIRRYKFHFWRKFKHAGGIIFIRETGLNGRGMLPELFTFKSRDTLPICNLYWLITARWYFGLVNVKIIRTQGYVSNFALPPISSPICDSYRPGKRGGNWFSKLIF